MAGPATHSDVDSDVEMGDGAQAEGSPQPVASGSAAAAGASEGTPDAAAPSFGSDALAAAAAPAAGADGAAGDEEDDDPVVQECDVYLNRMYDPPEFVGDMYVLQYPLRPCYREYGDHGELDKVEMKEKARRLRFVYKLHASQNYDGDSVISEKLGRRHVLSSTVVANPDCSYAIGVIHQGRMTLTPIRAVNQLRPDFEDFDRERAKRSAMASKAAASAAASSHLLPNEDSGGGASSGDSGPEESTALAQASNDLVPREVRVEFRPGAKHPVGAATQEVEPEEPWTRLDYYNRLSEEANDVYHRHLVWPAAAAAHAEHQEQGAPAQEHVRLQRLEMDGDPEVLLETMCGAENGEKRRAERRAQIAEAAKAGEKDGLSMYILSRMPVERQVEALARQYVVMSYSRHLRKRLPPATLRALGTEEALIAELRKSASLVSGNWVLKSDLAGFEGAEAHARDLLLCMLNLKKGTLLQEEYRRWMEVLQKHLTKQSFEEIRRNVLDRDPATGGQRLKERPDQDFMRRFPQVVEEFGPYWERVRREASQSIMATQAQGPGGLGGKQQVARQSAAHRHRAKLMQDIREALANSAMALPDLRRTIQGKNPQVQIREEEILFVLQPMQQLDGEVVKVRDLYACGRTGNEANDKFRAVVHSTFRSRDHVSMLEILNEYKRAHGEDCRLSSFSMRTFLREIADKLDGDNWVMKGALMREQ